MGEVESHFTSEDRENLIELRVDLRNLQASFSDFKLSLKEDNKASKEEVKYLEGRIRTLENFRYWILGMGILGGTIVHFFLDKIK